MNSSKETSESLGISYSLLEKLALLFSSGANDEVTMITVGACHSRGHRSQSGSQAPGDNPEPKPNHRRWSESIWFWLATSSLESWFGPMGVCQSPPTRESSAASSLSYFYAERGGRKRCSLKSKHTKLFLPFSLFWSMEPRLSTFWPITNLSCLLPEACYLLVAIATGISLVFKLLTGKTASLTPSILGNRILLCLATNPATDIWK